MELAKNFSHQDIEDKWYSHWTKKRYFNSTPDERESYTITIPPPNVTGVLHMGHMLNNTIQDVLIRKARMQGYNACWVPGTDHASIATEAKVVQRLRKQGIKKSDLSRDEFMKHAWAWKEEHSDIIKSQLIKLGASCDWERERFTMDENYHKQVIKVFVDLFRKGHIFRGLRMINWDPKAQTALSNEEVIYHEEQSHLHYIMYRIDDKETYEFITIATTRPETMLGDTAIAVHPEDERYKHLIGKRALIPMINRSIPIIADDYVEMEFGTGALKVTPAHDPNDYDLGKKHNLEVIDVITDDGRIAEAGQKFIGMDRFEARAEIIGLLYFQGHIAHIETITNKVGHSERTDAVVEPKLSLQWFLDMTKLAPPAIEHVENNNVAFHPDKFKNTYNHWMNNIREWCLSRQLWWGQQIPAYFYGTGDEDFVVAESAEEALSLAKEKSGNDALSPDDLKQDEDVLDTWASSWIWPMAVFDGLLDSENEDIKYYYPTKVLVTAPEILFFWVARMIMSGFEYRDKKPFDDVYLTGIVRDKKRRKMSKSLGNSPDPLDMIDKYGADAVRVGMLLCSPAGNDILFDVSLVEQGAKFMNKIWNALKLIKMWEVNEGQNANNDTAHLWFENKFNETLASVNSSYESYRISEALMSCYTLVWDDYCSWYLEMIKPEYGEAIDSHSLEKATRFLEDICKLLHPLTPFISEEVYHLLREREDDVCVASWPADASADTEVINAGEKVKDVVSKIREARAKVNLAKKERISAFLKSDSLNGFQDYKFIIEKLAGLSELSTTSEDMKGVASFLSGSDHFFVDTGVEVDAEAEKARIEEEIVYNQGFIAKLDKKLSNEKFVAGAPEAVVELERKKRQDAEDKIKILEDQLKLL